MTRSRNSRKGYFTKAQGRQGFDLWGKRPGSGYAGNKFARKRTARLERRADRKSEREAVDTQKTP